MRTEDNHPPWLAGPTVFDTVQDLVFWPAMSLPDHVQLFIQPPALLQKSSTLPVHVTFLKHHRAFCTSANILTLLSAPLLFTQGHLLRAVNSGHQATKYLWHSTILGWVSSCTRLWGSQKLTVPHMPLATLILQSFPHTHLTWESLSHIPNSARVGNTGNEVQGWKCNRKTTTEILDIRQKEKRWRKLIQLQATQDDTYRDTCFITDANQEKKHQYLSTSGSTRGANAPDVILYMSSSQYQSTSRSGSGYWRSKDFSTDSYSSRNSKSSFNS